MKRERLNKRLDALEATVHLLKSWQEITIEQTIIKQLKDPGMKKLVLIPVQVFLGPDNIAEAYGLRDAIGSQSDCNRAIGHIFRVEELSNPCVDYLKPGEFLTIEVRNSEATDEFFNRNWDLD